MYDILGFFNLLYLPQITEYIFFILIFLFIGNILVLFCHSFHFRYRKINLCNLANFNLLAKVPKHNGIVCLYSINICYDIFISYGFLNFFRSMFNSKTIKMSYISYIHIKSNPIISYQFVLIKIYYICPILYFK